MRPGMTYEVLDGEIEVAPGLRLVPTPGHTAGHQSLVLDADDGTVVLAGQALQSRAEWDGATEPSASGASTADRSRLPGLGGAPPLVRPGSGAFRPRPRRLGTLTGSADRDPAVRPVPSVGDPWYNRRHSTV